MSWIIGFVGASLSHEIRARLASFFDARILESSGEGHFIASGGPEETCLAGCGADFEWIVSGTGISLDNSASRVVDRSGWQARLSEKRPDIRQIGGGFVATRWDGRAVEAFSDSLGLRTFFWMKFSGGFAFSTHLHWLAALRGGIPIDYSVFGSHWLAFNQFGFGCLARDIRRLP
ncbi:MAG: hypothetical protein WED81_06780, partial [Rhodothermales bacterium]